MHAPSGPTASRPESAWHQLGLPSAPHPVPPPPHPVPLLTPSSGCSRIDASDCRCFRLELDSSEADSSPAAGDEAPPPPKGPGAPPHGAVIDHGSDAGPCVWPVRCGSSALLPEPHSLGSLLLPSAASQNNDTAGSRSGTCASRTYSSEPVPPAASATVRAVQPPPSSMTRGSPAPAPAPAPLRSELAPSAAADAAWCSSSATTPHAP
eukprot:356781-Chlamydomonas_euryale.AAC.1